MKANDDSTASSDERSEEELEPQARISKHDPNERKTFQKNLLHSLKAQLNDDRAADDRRTSHAENLTAKVLLEKYSARTNEKRVGKNLKGKGEKKKASVLGEKMFGVCIMICILSLPW